MSSHESCLHYPVPRTTITDPPKEYTESQQSRPLCPITLATSPSALLVTRYDDVKTVLSDARFSRDALFKPGAPRPQLAEPDQDSIISMDPPRHTRLRKLVNREFSPRRVEKMLPKIQAVADGLLDDMARKTPPVDLNEHLGRPLTLQVICDLLGVPYVDYSQFGFWCDRFVSYVEYPVEEVIQSNRDMRSYFTRLIHDKRATPGEDLLSALVEAHDATSALTEAELVSLSVALLIAGHDTTVTAIGGGLVTLLRNPDQLEELRGNLSLMPQAVEELVRLNEPGDGSFLRIATEDVELSGGTVPAGAAVIASISTADRDPSVFDDPHRLNIHRKHNPHLGFGHGTHFCVGSALAKAELQIALTGLLTRFAQLRLAVPVEDLCWRSYAHLGGIEELPVAW